MSLANKSEMEELLKEICHLVESKIKHENTAKK
jgi:hypothetical protein